MNNYTMNTADRLTHLKIVAVSLVAGIAVIGGDTDADDGDASDQRHSHDLEVGEAVCRIHRVVVHDTSPEIFVISRAWPLKGSISSAARLLGQLFKSYKDLDKFTHSRPTTVRHVHPLPFPISVTPINVGGTLQVPSLVHVSLL